jgi:predicted RNA-binding Zn ribbon-like protein
MIRNAPPEILSGCAASSTRGRYPTIRAYPKTHWRHLHATPALRALRDDLRTALLQRDDAGDQGAALLQRWFDQAALRPSVQLVQGALQLSVGAADNSFAGHILASVARAITAGEWARLKTCPDCQWAFYDHTRNGSKRWCGMSKGSPTGRACGTIAKVGAYRARQAETDGR